MRCHPEIQTPNYQVQTPFYYNKERPEILTPKIQQEILFLLKNGIYTNFRLTTGLLRAFFKCLLTLVQPSFFFKVVLFLFFLDIDEYSIMNSGCETFCTNSESSQ